MQKSTLNVFFFK